MALKRFPLEAYASLELNQVAFPKHGLVVSQTPLGEEFTAAAPCENGMWVLADKARGFIGSAEDPADAPIGIVYTTEKEYDIFHVGLKTFGRKIKGDYPRVGIMQPGDTVTTNCLQYDDKEFPDEEDAAEASGLYAALEKIDETPVYVVLVANSPVPKLTLTKPASGIYAKVTKFYTVPNGEKGVKYQIIRV